MKKFKAIIIMLLMFCISAGVCSCSGTPQDSETTTVNPTASDESQRTPGSMVLPIAHNDTLDPFKAASAINRSLVTLLYDSLIYIDADFQPQLLLAQSYELSTDSLNVTLRSAVFSDSTAVTAEDVKYSFDKAKGSSYYAARLSNISSATVSGTSVVFTLSQPDIYALSCLDFPIVKSGTVQAADSQTELYKLQIPTGSGRYVLTGTLPDATLKANTNCVRKENPYITTIHLFEVSDSDGMSYGLQIGNFDYWYNDLSSGQYTRVNAGLSSVETNNLVFLAFNSDKAILSEPAVRRAVSMLLDREAIVSNGFQGHASAAVLPFNPAWSTMTNIAANGKAQPQTQQAISLLESAGYNSVNSYGYRCSRTKSLNCTLTVCSDNPFKVEVAKQIKKQLAEVNFNITIIELGYEDYIIAVTEGNFEMYLGEIKITPNMNLNEFFSAGGKTNAVLKTVDEEGVTLLNVCCGEYQKLLAGETSLSDFCLLFESEMPFVPICYRNAVQVYSRNFKTQITGTCYDNFYGSDNWQIKSEGET